MRSEHPNCSIRHYMVLSLLIFMNICWLNLLYFNLNWKKNNAKLSKCSENCIFLTFFLPKYLTLHWSVRIVLKGAVRSDREITFNFHYQGKRNIGAILREGIYFAVPTHSRPSVRVENEFMKINIYIIFYNLKKHWHYTKNTRSRNFFHLKWTN